MQLYRHWGHGRSLERSHVAWKEYVDAFTFILRQFYGFMIIKQMGCLKAFRGNTNGAKHLRNVTSHYDFPRNVSRENMFTSGEVGKCRRNNQN